MTNQTNNAPLTDSPATRETLTNWLVANATVELAYLPEDTDPADHFDDEQDVAFARTSNPWHWFCAKVTVRYGDLAATDYLGCCSYESEADFKRPGGYYTDMIRTCCSDLVAQLMTARETVEAIWTRAR